MSYQKLFEEEGHNCVNKWSHYFEIYDDVFSSLKGKDNIKVLEIGIQNGGSLQLLSKYFGEKSQIYGLDIDQRCQNLKLGKNIFVGIGNASEKKTVQDFPIFDLIIDDGSHSPKDQRATLQHLFMDHLSEGGIYLIEDLEHSFQDWWKTKPSVSPFGKHLSFLQKPVIETENRTFVQDIQALVHEIQHKQMGPSQNEIANNTWKISNYSGIVVLYKKKPISQTILWSKGDRPVA